MALRKARLPVRLDQQVSLAHLPQLAGIDHGAHQLARGSVLHQAALPRCLDGLLHFGPDLPDHAGFDLGVELRVRRVLVRKKLAQQAFEGRSEIRAHGRPWREGRVQRLELLVGGQRVVIHRIARLAADTVSHFELRA